MKCAQGAFVLLNSLECAYWDGAIFERRGMVSFACDTLQSRLWLHAIWRILRVVMSLVSLFYEMSNVLTVTREWIVNKLTVKLISMLWNYLLVIWTVIIQNFIQGVSIYFKYIVNKQIKFFAYFRSYQTLLNKVRGSIKMQLI